uniref:Phosducin domain-containing protein n=1 Tax=Pinguiococcus pyrenoidosus TaxID=172671 RepID=A0A7R9UGG9_9STRA
MSLEDKMLKKNIPGKYSWWDDEDDHRGDDDDGEVQDPDEEGKDDLDVQRALQDAPEPVRRACMSQRVREKDNTGVKGVLRDFEEWRDEEDAKETSDAMRRNAALQRAARGAIRAADGGAHANVENADIDSDDEFLERYRRQRMSQLMAAAAAPTFGEVAEVSGDDFVETVDAVDPRAFVVVHLYEPFVHLCTKMNRVLEILARRQPSVKFLRMRADECRRTTGQEFDAIALPTLLVYRGGQTVATIVRVQDEVGEGLQANDVEWLLGLEGVFQASQNDSAAPQQIREGAQSSNRDNAADRLAEFALRIGNYDPLVTGDGSSRWHVEDSASETDEP